MEFTYAAMRAVKTARHIMGAINAFETIGITMESDGDRKSVGGCLYGALDETMKIVTAELSEKGVNVTDEKYETISKIIEKLPPDPRYDELHAALESMT